MNLNKFTSLVIVFLIYILAVLVSLFIVFKASLQSPLWQMALANLIATIVIYLFSTLTQNASVYDPYWSLMPVLTVFYWYWMVPVSKGATVYHQIPFVLVFIWGLRLTVNWIIRWKGMKDEDWRYTQLREKTKKWFPVVNFMGIHLMPTALTFFGSLPIYFFYEINSAPNKPIFIIALLFTLFAIVVEAVSDYQLRKFRQNNRDTHTRLKSGLWRKFNHPNYLGEMLFWWGIYFFSISANPAYWILFPAPLAITILFVFVSIPMMNKHLLSTKPEKEV